MKTLIACMALLLASAGAMAATKPFNMSLTPDVALCDRNDSIEGFTLCVWGENQQESFALGIANGTKERSAGFSLGFLNYGDNYRGLQLGLVNVDKQDAFGWQGCFFSSVVNWTSNSMTGLQTGVVNFAGHLKGVQFGFVNYADDGKSGVQIGLINIFPKNQWFSALPEELAPGMILVNWRF